MGYSFDRATGQLCCDACGDHGGVRKRKCPFGYCPADALCAACAKKHADKISKAAHRARGCESGHQEYEANRAREQAIIDGGGWLRIAALTKDSQWVHVLFRNKADETVGAYMPHASYDAIPILTPASLDDYARLGSILEAPKEFVR